MTSVVIVEKSGNIKGVKVASADELCKKCGFKSTSNYDLAHTWTVTFNDVEYKLDVYGKTKGKAGSENKYEFPPPIDNLLFFGNVAVIGREQSSLGRISDSTAREQSSLGRISDSTAREQSSLDNKYISLSVSEFNDIMEHLQGGYEELESDESDETDETTDIPKGAITKEGYVKDGFIASSDESDEEPVLIHQAKQPKKKTTKIGEATGKIVNKKPVKPRLKKKEEPQIAVYVEELTEDPYF